MSEENLNGGENPDEAGEKIEVSKTEYEKIQADLNKYKGDADHFKGVVDRQGQELGELRKSSNPDSNTDAQSGSIYDKYKNYSMDQLNDLADASPAEFAEFNRQKLLRDQVEMNQKNQAAQTAEEQLQTARNHMKTKWGIDPLSAEESRIATALQNLGFAGKITPELIDIGVQQVYPDRVAIKQTTASGNAKVTEMQAANNAINLGGGAGGNPGGSIEPNFDPSKLENDLALEELAISDMTLLDQLLEHSEANWDYEAGAPKETHARQ